MAQFSSTFAVDLSTCVSNYVQLTSVTPVLRRMETGGPLELRKREPLVQGNTPP